jgi:hypothetical protein
VLLGIFINKYYSTTNLFHNCSQLLFNCAAQARFKLVAKSQFLMPCKKQENIPVTRDFTLFLRPHLANACVVVCAFLLALTEGNKKKFSIKPVHHIPSGHSASIAK